MAAFFVCFFGCRHNLRIGLAHLGCVCQIQFHAADIALMNDIGRHYLQHNREAHLLAHRDGLGFRLRKFCLDNRYAGFSHELFRLHLGQYCSPALQHAIDYFASHLQLSLVG